MADEKDTLPNLETVIRILMNIQEDVREIKSDVQEIKVRVTNLEVRVTAIEARLENVENYAMLIMGKAEALEKRNEMLENRVEEGFEKMRLRFINIDENFADFQKVAHKALSVSAENRGEIIVLREELYQNLVEKLGIPRRDPLAGI